MYFVIPWKVFCWNLQKKRGYFGINLYIILLFTDFHRHENLLRGGRKKRHFLHQKIVINPFVKDKVLNNQFARDDFIAHSSI